MWVERRGDFDELKRLLAREPLVQKLVRSVLTEPSDPADMHLAGAVFDHGPFGPSPHVECTDRRCVWCIASASAASASAAEMTRVDEGDSAESLGKHEPKTS